MRYWPLEKLKEEFELTEVNEKQHYKDVQVTGAYDNSNGRVAYLPAEYEQYRRENNTDDFYRSSDTSGAGSFLLGALVGGVIGAAAALVFAPKTGSEMRQDLTSQASQLKSKSIEISTVAKEKASELSAVAKEKTGELSKTIQEQSGQIVDKVKSMTSKTTVPTDDGTASSEGEESIEFIHQVAENIAEDEEELTATGEAILKAVVGEEAETSTEDEDKTEA